MGTVLDVRIPVRYNGFRKEAEMKTINATAARADLYNLIHEVHENNEPALITVKNGEDAVLISRKNWEGWMETLYLYAIPGEVEKILAAEREPKLGYDELKGMTDEEIDQWLKNTA